MNIFYLHSDPIQNAKWYIDKHIVKMPLESTQMLSSVWHRYGHGDKVQYKEAFKNHPCTLWAGDSYENYLWLRKHALALCFEYTSRYDKIHKCQQVILDLLIPTKKIWQECFSTIHESCAKGFTPHPQCMPDIYKAKDTVQAYRQYYAYHKKDIAYWRKTPTPDWYIGMTTCNKEITNA